MIETKRCLIKQIEEQDLLKLYNILSEEDIAKQLTTDFGSVTPSNLYHFLGKTEAGTQSLVFVILNKENLKLIGCVTLNDIHPLKHSALLGSLAIKEKQPFLSVEVMKNILNYAFNALNLNRVYAYSWGDNEKMDYLYRRLGCQQEGTLRQDSYYQGWKDKKIWGLLREEFRDGTTY